MPVLIVVNRRGSVVKACATGGPALLRAAAETAARDWTFKKDFGNRPGGKREYAADVIVFDFVLATKAVSTRP